MQDNLNIEKKINTFNNWLSKNGHMQYLQEIESENVNQLKKVVQVGMKNGVI